MSSPGPESGPTRASTHLVPGFRRASTSDDPMPDPYPLDLPGPGDAGLAAEGSSADAYLTEAELAA